jgi:hypothetical protein
MPDVQYRVVSAQNLVLRGDGYKEALAVAAVTPGTIVHVMDERPNAVGFVRAYAFGWLAGDHRTLCADSLAPCNSRWNAILYEPVRAPDVYGRQPGEIHGYVAAKWLKKIEPEEAL